MRVTDCNASDKTADSRQFAIQLFFLNDKSSSPVRLYSTLLLAMPVASKLNIGLDFNKKPSVLNSYESDNLCFKSNINQSLVPVPSSVIKSLYDVAEI